MNEFNKNELCTKNNIDYVWQGVDLVTRNYIAYNEVIATRRTESGGGEIKRRW